MKELIDRVTLKELPVNKQNANAKSNNNANADNKYKLADGDYPKMQVDLYEQMVFHRSSSINLKPLQILVPTRYKINHKKIIQYLDDKASDENTQALVTDVIKEYGNNNNSLFYQHTISGKSNSSGLDLDEKKIDLIKSRIDKWHNDYAGWIFYDNASTFFIQNSDIPRDELITLKIELDEVFNPPPTTPPTTPPALTTAVTTKGLTGLVNEIADKYDELIEMYKNKGVDAIIFFKDTLSPYIKFFKRVFEQIKNQMNDQLNFITNRKENMGTSYDFNDTIKATIFKTYEELKMILDNFGDINIVSYLNVLTVINIFKTQIFDLNKKFPLKTVFDDYILNHKKIIRSNVVYSSKNPDNMYDIQEINHVIVGYADATEGITEDFINKLEFKPKSSSGQLTSFEFQDEKLDLDILFYLLYRATNIVVYDIMQHPDKFEPLDEMKTKGLSLRKLQQDVDLKEKNLKNICDLIAKTGKFPVERILPDNKKYYYTDADADRQKKGFVNPDYYKIEWGKILEKKDGQINSSHIIFAISEMKDKLDKGLGIYNEGDIKIKQIKTTLMSTLIEYNTVQVLNMLFGKPRPILYSPSLRINFLTGTSKWIFFQVDKPEIVSKRAFRIFKKQLNAVSESKDATADASTLVELILQKKTVNKDNRIDLSANEPPPICAFIISTTPGPQLLATGKDSINDSRLENTSFSEGVMGENGLLVDDG